MVSIIIPAYNVEKYIEKCIRSAMSQTMKEIEIIVINDGSKDLTQTIVEKLLLEDKRIKLINKKNGGLSSARNVGILEAKGEYIQHVDGDDWIEKETCEELYELAKKENLDLILCDFYKDFNDKKIKEIKSFQFKENILLESKLCLQELNKSNLNVAICSKFIKREIYLKNNIHHLEGISLGEDLVTTPKLIVSSKRIMKKNKKYYHYIYNITSITNSNFSKKIGELFLCFEELYNYYDKKNIETQDLKELESNHMANFIYKISSKNQEILLVELEKFYIYVKKLDVNIVKNIKKRYLYLLLKWIPTKKLFFKAIFNITKVREILCSIYLYIFL